MAAALAVGLAPGCGGGRSLTDWAKEAVPACAARDKAVKGVNPPTALTAMAGTVDEVDQAVDAARAKLARLHPPGSKNDKAAAAGVDRAAKDLIESLKAWRGLVYGADYGAMERGLDAAIDKAKTADAAARKADAPACATLAAALGDPFYKAGVSNIKRGFIDRADGACAAENKALDDALAKTHGPEGIILIADYLDKRVTTLTSATPPGNDKDNLDGFVAGIRELAARVRSAPAAAQTAAGLTRLEADLAQEEANVDAKGSAYGFHNCLVEFND
jgi:hypothetical protein